MEGLKQVYFALKALKDANANEFLFFNKMKSPIKRLKNKYRYQVLMRIRPNNDKIRDKIYEIVSSFKLDNTFINVEENPSNLS